MGYSLQDYVDLISQYKETQPELAFAIYNGVSGMGGGMPGNYETGALDSALRNAWGEDIAKNWVNTSSDNFGNAMFDPKTGQYGYYKNGAISSGTVGNYNGANFDPNQIKYEGPPTSRNPLQFPGQTPPNPVTPQPKIAATQPDPSGGTTLGSLSRTVNPGTVTPYGQTNVPGASHGPITNTTAPLQPGGNPLDPNSLNRGTNTNSTATPPIGTTTGDPNYKPPTPSTGPLPPTTTAPPPPASQPFIPGATTAPPGNTGNTGDMPMASAAPWSVPAAANKPFDFYNDEGYQFRKKEGMDKIENSAAAHGGLASGATLKSLAAFNSGLASEEYDKAFGRFDTGRKFDEANAVDSRNYNNENRKWDSNFNNANRIDARNFDFNASKDARDFATALAEWNTKFGYDADHAQQKEQMDTLLQMAKLGYLSESQMADLAKELSRQVSGNTMTGAIAAAGGGVGAAGDLSSLASQISTYISKYNLVPHN